jgi:Putative Ig domain
MARTRWVPCVAMAAWLVLVPSSVQARSITLAWDPNPRPDVAGYTVFYGAQSHVYTNFVDVGNLLAYQFNLPGSQYYFAVRAYTTSGAISPLSEELAESSAITVTNPGDQSDAVGASVILQLVVKGPPVSYAANNLPVGLGINSSTGQISGTISAGAAASSPYFVSASASAKNGRTSSVQFTWTVADFSKPPTLTPPANQSSAVHAVVTLPIVASDPNGVVLSFSAAGLPAGLSINPVSGVIHGIVAAGARGTHHVILTVFDGELAASASFNWKVSAHASRRHGASE